MTRTPSAPKLAGWLLLACLLSACGPSPSLLKPHFYDFGRVSVELSRIRAAHPDIVRLVALGNTEEGRSILAARLSGLGPISGPKPAILAIFTEHADEHDTTGLGVGILSELAARYPVDDEVRRLLDNSELWIVPMMNPDGVEYDLSGRVKPMTWRKNRRSTGIETYGVDLNRNWGRPWEAAVPRELADDLSNPKTEIYAGEHPFSEKETQALRDFLLANGQIRLFVDYHSGRAFFLQGGVGFPIPPDGFGEACHRTALEQLAEGLAAAISNPSDPRPAFVVSKERDVAPLIRKHAPWYVKTFIPRSIPAAPGTSGEWVYGALGIAALGVETMHDSNFFSSFPQSMSGLVKSQVPGVIYLLKALSEDPLRCGSPSRRMDRTAVPVAGHPPH